MEMTSIFPRKIVIADDALPLLVPLFQLWNDVVTHVIDPWIRALLEPKRRFLSGATIMYFSCVIAVWCVVLTGPLWLWCVWTLFLAGYAMCLLDLSHRTRQYGSLVAAMCSYCPPLRELLSRPLPQDASVHEVVTQRSQHSDVAFHLSRLAVLSQIAFSRDEVLKLLDGCSPWFVHLVTSTPESLRRSIVSSTAITRAEQPKEETASCSSLPAAPAETDIPPEKLEIARRRRLRPPQRSVQPSLVSVLESIAMRRINFTSCANFMLFLLQNSDFLASAALAMAAVVRRSRKHGLLFLLALFMSFARRRMTRMIMK